MKKVLSVQEKANTYVTQKAKISVNFSIQTQIRNKMNQKKTSRRDRYISSLALYKFSPQKEKEKQRTAIHYFFQKQAIHNFPECFDTSNIYCKRTVDIVMVMSSHRKRRM